jgi:hypothetical protein
MNFWTILEGVIGGAVGGWAVVFGLSKHLGDRLLEGLRAQHGRELAELGHQRSVLLAEMQNAFSMGTSSHMATVAFDKHIGFCEEYVDAVSSVLRISGQQRVAANPLDVTNLTRIRQKWALWLTDDIENKLDQFEDLILRVPFEAPVSQPDGTLAPTAEATIRSVIADLRKVLATEELTALRSELAGRSIKRPANVP